MENVHLFKAVEKSLDDISNVVSDLIGEIEKLEVEIDEANATIGELESEIRSLKKE